MITRKEVGHISEELLDQLLVALHPIYLDESSTKFHIGYHKAQDDFRFVLENRLNAGPLPKIKAGEFTVVATPARRWWKLW